MRDKVSKFRLQSKPYLFLLLKYITAKGRLKSEGTGAIATTVIPTVDIP